MSIATCQTVGYLARSGCVQQMTVIPKLSQQHTMTFKKNIARTPVVPGANKIMV